MNIMTDQYYIVNGGQFEFNRKEFVEFLTDIVVENNLIEFIACETVEQAKRRIKARPLCTGRKLGFEVCTYTK